MEYESKEEGGRLYTYVYYINSLFCWFVDCCVCYYVFQSCCYYWWGSLMTREATDAGNFFRYHPTYRVNHYLADVLPKQWCCERSDLCHLFYNARPLDRCYGYSPPFLGKYIFLCSSRFCFCKYSGVVVVMSSLVLIDCFV